MDILSVQKHVRFRITTDLGDYVDAVTLPENAAVDPVALEVIAQVRAKAWRAAVKNAPPVDELPRAALEQQEAEAQERLADIRTRMAELAILQADTTPPTVPQQVQGTVVQGAVELTWAPSTDASGILGYRVEREGAVLARCRVEHYTDATAQPGQTYRYRITAIDRAGNSSARSVPATIEMGQQSAQGGTRA